MKKWLFLPILYFLLPGSVAQMHDDVGIGESISVFVKKASTDPPLLLIIIGLVIFLAICIGLYAIIKRKNKENE